MKRTARSSHAAGARRFFASCSRGLEDLLVAELAGEGVRDLRQTVGGVQFSGSLEDGYRACLWSRVASRVLVQIGEVDARDADTLHAGVADLPWELHFTPGATLAVDFIGVSEQLRNSLFGARRVKDGIVDRLRAVSGERPDVELRNPDIRVLARLHRARVVLSIDLGGEARHRRGYRGGTGAAPLKENLAAALLMRAGWGDIAASGGALYDPLCGSGTLLIEGALLAADAAPGEAQQVARGKWAGHDPELWERLIREAVSRRRAGLQRLPPIAGADADERVLQHARANADASGFGERIALGAGGLEAQTCPERLRDHPGLLICNPPYGERLGEAEKLRALYAQLGELARREFGGWRIAMLGMEGPLPACTGLDFARRYRVRNGPLDCTLFVHDGQRPARRAPAAVQAPGPVTAESQAPRSDTAPAPAPVAGSGATPGEGAQMFANRLRKNLRRMKGWLVAEQPSCYRLYDADIPEYAVAVDRYADWVHVAEYAPPATVDPALARARLEDVRAALVAELGVAPSRIVLKTRDRQRGARQYQRLAHENHYSEVREGPARLLVNLRDFLDTGLFLDHRPARRMITELARGARFLNLFCYTGAATVFAALGGARASTSVDLSATYLDWAARNLALNGIDPALHRLERADCLHWMKEQRARWDLIFLDPPSFSNSKRMDATLDVQRDHPELIRTALALLEPGGTLLFSTNRRGFRLDTAALGDIGITDLSEQSHDPDFRRKPLAHRLYRIRHAGVR